MMWIKNKQSFFRLVFSLISWRSWSCCSELLLIFTNLPHRAAVKCNEMQLSRVSLSGSACVVGLLFFRQSRGRAAEPDGARRPASRLHPHGNELHRPKHPPTPSTPPPRARQHAGRHHRPSPNRCEHPALCSVLYKLCVSAEHVNNDTDHYYYLFIYQCCLSSALQQPEIT